MLTNAYYGQYRACKVAGMWRIMRRNPNAASRMEWLFVNEYEYATATDAIMGRND